MDDTIAWSLSVISTTTDRWQQLTHALPAELLERAPAAGEWSAIGCLRHMVEIEQIFHSRIQAFMEGRESFPSHDPDAQGIRAPTGISIEQLVNRFAELREESLQILNKLEPEDLARPSRHMELGPVVLGEMIHEWAAHDLNHTMQAERALMQPFIAACGPWKRYFAHHIHS